MTDLIHAELSYAVRGVLSNVYNSLGPMLKEEFYERAIAIGLDKRGIRCETQKQFELPSTPCATPMNLLRNNSKRA